MLRQLEIGCRSLRALREKAPVTRHRHARPDGRLFLNIALGQQHRFAPGLLGQYPAPGIDDRRMPMGFPWAWMHAALGCRQHIALGLDGPGADQRRGAFAGKRRGVNPAGVPRECCLTLGRAARLFPRARCLPAASRKPPFTWQMRGPIALTLYSAWSGSRFKFLSEFNSKIPAIDRQKVADSME